MGIKRWLLALFILVLVLGLLALLFLQSGADERIIESLIPRVEERLGVRISFEDVDISLSSVVFENVEVRSKEGSRPLALVESLGVGVRVGSLLMGDLDLTGIRMDGLEIRMGEPLDGAQAVEWKELIERVAKGTGTGAQGDGPMQPIPEIHLVSGRLVADDGRFSVTVEGLSGRFSAEGGAVVTTDDFTLVHLGRNLVFGESGEVQLRSEREHVSLSLNQPGFDLPVAFQDLEKLVKDARDSARALGMIDSQGGLAGTDGGVEEGNEQAEAGPADDDEGISVKVAVLDASGVLSKSGDKNLEMKLSGVSGEISLTRKRALMIRASGQMPGTDARWVLGASWSKEEDPSASIEIPDMPLKTVGEMFVPNKHIEWGRASVDGTAVVELQDNGEKLAFEGQASISGVEVNHPRLAAEPIEDLDAHLDFKASYEQGKGQLNLERLMVVRGLARITLRGNVVFDRFAFDISGNVPPTACRQILQAVPSQLKPRLEGVQLEGLIALDMRLGIDENAPGETALEVNLDNRCRITNFGTVPNPQDFQRPFSYIVYGTDAEPMRLISGPGTDRWTPYSMISPYLVEAALTTEDGKFRHHQGVTIPEIRRAIELNLKKDSLSHGASTITMQLAKNLFMNRERTVARKLQELFFTWYLESQFTKDEILELYFNVIEFGPSLYGIKEAAGHYFGREPHELNLVESVFLIKLLPSPITRHGTYTRSQVSERKMNSLHRVMKTMFDRGRIDRAELAEGWSQELRFHHEGDPLPESRMPISRSGIRVLPSGDEEYGDEEPLSEPEWSNVVPE